MATDFIDDESFADDENDFDAVIVGAGISGLTCAYEILRRRTGLNLLIVEANDEIGGRLLPEEYSETFHANSLQKHVTKLVHGLRLTTYPRERIDGRRRIVYRKGGPIEKLPRHSAAEIDSFLRTERNTKARFLAEQLHQVSLEPGFSEFKGHELAEELAESSAENLLGRIVCTPFGRSICRAFIGCTCGVRDLNDVSALWLLVTLNGAGGFLNRLRVDLGDENRYFVQGGMKRMAKTLLRQIMAEQGEILYGEPATTVRYNDDRAYVVTDRNCFKCDVVVLAVSPPVLDRINIEPELTTGCYRNANSLYTSGRGVFFNVSYKRPFWRDVYTGDILTTNDSGANLRMVYDASRPDKYTLAGFLDNASQSQSPGHPFDTIAESFNTTEANRCLIYKERRLRREDAAPMAVLRPSSISDHVNLADQPNERILFASSEYARDWPGTVDGAVEAGRSAAHGVLSKMRPQAVTFRDIIEISRKRSKRRHSRLSLIFVRWFGIVLNASILISFLRDAYKNV